ncbi:hypothetical protein EOL73_00830 [Candidatus Saccharibacteria bacterium]|nr:hypothetical protein [Candidatus Saccharibacteria bacterium]NCU40288.1 hypothetical protein [Candidatus Saccharibacteria bacterium]
MRLFHRFTKNTNSVRSPHLEDQSDYTFRRSRTITGAVSSEIRVASEQNSQLRSDRLKTHDLRTHRRKLGGVFLLCLASVAFIYALLSQSIFSVQIATEDVTRVEAYKDTVNSYFSSRPGERFSFSLQSATLTRYAQQRHPEVKNVEVALTGFLQPAQVAVELRQPVASWVIGGKQYYIDASGVAFEQIVGVPPTLVVEDKSGIDPNSSSSVAPERMIRYVGRLVAILSEKGQGVSRLELPLLTSRQVDVYLEGRGYGFKTSIDRDPAGQVADIVNIISYLDTKQIVPVSYVDVRVSSKAFYR